MRKKYILLKDTPEFKKGAIFEEMCDDGTQDFKLNFSKSNRKYFTKPKDYIGIDNVSIGRETVMKQPKWFRKIDIVEIDGKNIEISAEQLKKIKKIIKK